MMISHKLQLIFIEAPRTGSTSFRLSLKELDPAVEELNPRHMTALEAKPLIDPQIWDTYNKIAFIRNPDDWVDSVVGRPFIALMVVQERTLFDWYTDENGNMLVDNLYRTEDLNQIFTANKMTVRKLNNRPKRTVVSVTLDSDRLREPFMRSPNKLARERAFFNSPAPRKITLSK